jgi:hypothetical protein
MYSLLKKVKTIKENRQDTFFGFRFNSLKEIYLGRGFSSVKNKNVSKYILDH